METFQVCWQAFDAGDLSVCKPLGLDLGAWAAIVGAAAAIVAIGAFFRKAVFSGVKAVLRPLKPKPGPIPQPQNTTLFGRDGDIARLDEIFTGAPSAVAVTGQGGIGKTALAEEYGRLRVTSGRYRDWVLVSTASDTDMANDLRSNAALLGVEENQNPKTMIELTYKAMAESGDRWLVILDNVDEEETQRRVLKGLRSVDGIDHLITSRIQDWHDRAIVVDLELLAPDEAVELLAWASGREADAALRKLANETLERLPLALVVAGADLRTMSIGIDEYASEFNERLHVAPKSVAYEKSIYVAVSGSVEHLSENAQAFLKLAAFMEPSDIDAGYLAQGTVAVKQRGWEDLPAPFVALTESSVALQAAAAECARHSLLTDAKWEKEDTFRVHRMTQFVLRDWMGADVRKQMIGLAARIGRAQFSDRTQFDPESWPKCRRLAPHARALVGFGAEVDHQDAKVIASFVHQTATFLRHAMGDSRLVMELNEQNLPDMERAFGPDSSNYASALCNLACAQDSLGRSVTSDEAVRFDQQAEKNFKESIKIESEIEGHELDRAYVKNNLGAFYSARMLFQAACNEYFESLQILEKALAGDEFIGGAHGNIGVLYSNWADAATHDEEKTEYRQNALIHYEKALQLTRKALGELNFSVKIQYHNVSSEHVILGNFERSLPYAIRSTAIPLIMLDQGVIDYPDHPQLLETLNLLMNTLRALGRDPNDAENLARAEIPNVLADHAAWKNRQVDQPE